MFVSEVEPASAAVVQFELGGSSGLSPGLVAGLTAACDRAEDDGAALLLRLTDGTGELDWPGDVTMQSVTRWERAVSRLERLSAGTIAVADGVCRGACAEVLLATDYRVVTEDFRLRLPFHADGMWPGMALYRLGRQLGPGRARRFVLFDDDVTAADALELGLVDEVTGQAPTRGAAVAERLGRWPHSEVAVRKRLLRESLEAGFADALGSHLAACDRALRHAARSSAVPQ